MQRNLNEKKSKLIRDNFAKRYNYDQHLNQLMYFNYLYFIFFIIFILFLINNANFSNSNSLVYDSKAILEEKPYNIEADIEVINHTVIVKEDLTLKKATKKIIVYLPSINKAKTSIKQITLKRGYSKLTEQDDTLVIDSNIPENHLHIEYEIALEEDADTLSYSKESILLTNFLVTPAVYQNNNPVYLYCSKIGDPYIYDINDYSIRFTTDKIWHVFAPGQKSQNISGDKKTTVFSARNMRDFPIVLFTHPKVEISKIKDIAVYYINSSNAKESVTEALNFGVNNIGPYPYKEFYVVRVSISQRGMEFSNMIFLDDSCFADKDLLKKVTYHEVMHQWFYGIIGTNPLDEPFFKEGIVEYLTSVINRESLVGKSYCKEDFSLRLSQYSSEEEFYKLAYGYSCNFFYEINKRKGDDFFKTLRKVYDARKFTILSFDEFLDYFN
jgi:hypothetical protein